MLKISRTSIVVVAFATVFAAGGVVWAGTTHTGHVSGPSALTVAVKVRAANPAWTDTGVALEAHHALKITATGSVSNGLFLVSPRGRPVANWNCTHFNGYQFAGPELNCWSLIGRSVAATPSRSATS